MSRLAWARGAEVRSTTYNSRSYIARAVEFGRFADSRICVGCEDLRQQVTGPFVRKVEPTLCRPIAERTRSLRSLGHLHPMHERTFRSAQFREAGGLDRCVGGRASNGRAANASCRFAQTC